MGIRVTETFTSYQKRSDWDYEVTRDVEMVDGKAKIFIQWEGKRGTRQILVDVEGMSTDG